MFCSCISDENNKKRKFFNFKEFIVCISFDCVEAENYCITLFNTINYQFLIIDDKVFEEIIYDLEKISNIDTNFIEVCPWKKMKNKRKYSIKFLSHLQKYIIQYGVGNIILDYDSVACIIQLFKRVKEKKIYI